MIRHALINGALIHAALVTFALVTFALPAVALPAQTQQPAAVLAATAQSAADYVRRVAEIPMRDGVTLHTVIVIPKGASGAPILLTRTPYSADWMAGEDHPAMATVLDRFDHVTDVILDGGYIRVVQDIRGKFGSGGDFVVTRPLRGTSQNASDTDEATDAWDTIDWLVKNLPESNGRVGAIGISYDGFETLMATIDPHPALKVAVPMDPMVDGWRGDDWMHNGAFRQMLMPAIFGGEERDNSGELPWGQSDLYDIFMRAGSAGELGRRHGMEAGRFWREITRHPAYDDYWRSQAVDMALSERPLTVPMMIVSSLWDQEDIYGALAVYRALEPKDSGNDKVFLSIGPWSHGQSRENGSHLGDIQFGEDTARAWRSDVLAPFLARYLKNRPMDVAPVTAFRSGDNTWHRAEAWPTEATVPAKLYLRPGLGLGFEAAPGPATTVDYVSDPARPVTFLTRPIRSGDERWSSWLTSDQRNASSRPDVLTFTSEVLTAPVMIAGRPVAHLTASTSGTDSDWIVKLIDVYPDETPQDPAMSGYQLPIAMDIFRGRYRETLSEGRPLQANAPLRYEFALPNASHVFRPGHRIMVQIQSSWFPLYDRNPQTFVPNIFFAEPADFVAATQKVTVSGPEASFISLPIVQQP